MLKESNGMPLNENAKFKTHEADPKAREENCKTHEADPKAHEEDHKAHKENRKVHKENLNIQEESPYRERRMFISFSIIHRFAKIFLSAKMEQLGTLKCSPPYIAAIYHNPGLSQNELSEFLKIDKGAVAKTVKCLLAKGFIEREKDPLDKRGYKLYLTKKGETLMPNLLTIESGFERKITEGMSNEEKELLTKLINKAATNILSLDTGEKNENNI